MSAWEGSQWQDAHEREACRVCRKPRHEHTAGIMCAGHSKPATDPAVCASCGHAASDHPFRHPFKAGVYAPPAPAGAGDLRAVEAAAREVASAADAATAALDRLGAAMDRLRGAK